MDTRRRACTITSRQRRSADRTDRSPVVSDSEVGREPDGIFAHTGIARRIEARTCSTSRDDTCPPPFGTRVPASLARRPSGLPSETLQRGDGVAQLLGPELGPSPSGTVPLLYTKRFSFDLFIQTYQALEPNHDKFWPQDGRQKAWRSRFGKNLEGHYDAGDVVLGP